MVDFKYYGISFFIHLLLGLSIATNCVSDKLIKKDVKENSPLIFMLEQEQKNTNKEYLHYANKIGKKIKYTPKKPITQQQNLETKANILYPTSKPSEQKAYSGDQDKNEITYRQAFRTEVSKYCEEKDYNYYDIWAILMSNRNLKKIIYISFTFDEQGNFKITKMEPAPRFRDRNNKALEHLREFFSEFNNGKFLSLKTYNIEAPHTEEYYIRNPLYKEKLSLF